MAKSGIKLDGLAIGILAIIAGILILFKWLELSLVIGVFLLVYGIITIIRR
jgi:uncharacterized membrane protein HdeD (DUF308 family)